MSNIITIIAYKSSGYRSIRGCVTDQWGSGFQMDVFDDIEEAIKCLGKLMVEDRHSKEGEYEYHILIDGKDESYIYEDEDEAIHKQVSDGAEKYLQDAIKAEEELIEISRQNEAKRVKEEQKQKKLEELEILKIRVSEERINENRARIKKLEEELDQE